MNPYEQVRTVYNRLLRPHLPDVVGTKSGMKVKDFKLLDFSRSDPNYKRGLVEAVREHAPGRKVIEVGTGRGLVTSHTVDAGATEVHGYEAAAEMVSLARETLRMNVGDEWSETVTLHHAVIGEPENVYGSTSGSETIPAEELEGDVLVLDVEGAEMDILPQFGDADVVICETHPAHGAPEGAISAIIEDRGFSVEVRPYHPDRPDKSVVVGVADGG